MTVVNPKSISGINSITTGSGSDDILTIHTNNGTERLRVDSTGTTKIVTGIVTTLTATTGIVTTLTANTVTSLGAISGTTGTFSGAVSGTTGTFSSHVSLGDDDELRLGTGDDLKLYHNGSQSYVANGTGNLNLSSGEAITLKTNTSEAAVICNNNGSVELYHDNLKKFETTSGGVYVTGAAVFPDGTSNGIQIGNSSDLQLYHDGSSSIIKNITGDLYLQSIDDVKIRTVDSELAINCVANGSVELYHNNVNKFSTQTYGIAVDGVLTLTKDSADDQTSTLQINGSAMDSDGYNYLMSASNNSNANLLTIFINGSGRTSDGGANGLTIRNDNGPMSVGANSGTYSNTFYTGLAGGIDFSASGNHSSMSSEKLDDYEEGTWTLGIAHDAISEQYGRYTKIGRMVYATFEITFGSSNNGSHQYITGLPFTSQASSDNGGNCGGVARDYQNYDIENGPIYHIQQNNTVIYFYKNNGQVMTASNTSGYNFRGTAVYHAA